MKKKKSGIAKISIVVLACVGVLGLGAIIWRDASSGKAIQADLTVWNADNPSDSYDLFQDSLTVLERAQVPEESVFVYPVGTKNGELVYDAQCFLSNNKKRGGLHSGADLNGLGGEDTDFGDDIYSIGKGLVIYAATPGKGWGNVVVVAHRLPDGRIIQSVYAHLSKMLVTPGRIVQRREKIAEMGNANGCYLSHLHFEILDGELPGAGWPAYWENIPENRINPKEFLKKFLVARESLPQDFGEESGVMPQIIPGKELPVSK